MLNQCMSSVAAAACSPPSAPLAPFTAATWPYCLCSAMAAPDSPQAVVAALEGRDILAAALAVLREPDPHCKAALTELIVRAWHGGRIHMPAPGGTFEQPPDRPARDETKVGIGRQGGPETQQDGDARCAGLRPN